MESGVSGRVCHLQLEAAEHEQEDAGQAAEAQGQAHEQLKEQALPGRVVELLCAGYRADPTHSLRWDSNQTEPLQGPCQALPRFSPPVQTSAQLERPSPKFCLLLPFSEPWTHPELGSWLLYGLPRGVQSPPLIGQLSAPAFPLLQEQRGPDHVEEGEDHAGDIPASLREEAAELWASLTRQRGKAVGKTGQGGGQGYWQESLT